jgi:hypothetical protein
MKETYMIKCRKHPDYRGVDSPTGECEVCKTIHTLAHQEAAHSERPHHTESASSLQPKEWCVFYQGRDSTSEAAEIGTKLHEHAERGTTEGLDDQEAMLVQMCLDHVAACKQEMQENYGNVKLLQEVYGNVDQIEWPAMKEKSTSGGFVDVVLESQTPDGPVIHVIDYKFGQWAVEDAENNLQGIVYLLNYRQAHPTLHEATVSFLMPKLEEISTHTFKREDFARLYTRVKRLVAVRNKIREGGVPKGAVEAPCFHTCMWCGRIADCQTLTAEVAKAARKFSPLTVPADLNIQSIDEKSDISAWVKFADVVRAYAGAVRERCTDLVVSNPDLTPDTHTLVTQQERRVASYTEFESVLVEQGVPIEKIVEIRRIGLTDAKKLVASLAPKGMKTAAQEALDEALVERDILVPDGQKIYLKAKKEASGE